MSSSDKRKEIREIVLSAIEKEGEIELGYLKAKSRKVALETLFEEETVAAAEGWRTTELFELRQGVTWGGSGCESIFVVGENISSELEQQLTRRTIGGEDIRPGRIEWHKKYLVFPYFPSSGKWTRAFEDSKLGGVDALDFDINTDASEKGKSPNWKLSNRTAKGYVTFPKTAEYLLRYYETLKDRIFKDRPLSDYKKMWYEFIWQRDPSLTLKPKIVCPRLMRIPTFALDEEGYLPRDSVIALIPKPKLKEVVRSLQKTLDGQAGNTTAFRYILAFLNSQVFYKLLAGQRAKKRGGYPMVGEAMLNRFVIPRPTKEKSVQVRGIINDQSSVEIDSFYATTS